MTKQKIAFFVISFLLMSVTPVMAQEATAQKAQTEAAAALDTSAIDTTSLLLDEAVAEMDDSTAVADGGAYTQLKKKFTDGGVWFMSLVALCLIIGLAFCIERIIYLTLSEIDAKKFMVHLEEKLKTEGVEAAKDLCRNTRGSTLQWRRLSEASVLTLPYRWEKWKRDAPGSHCSSLWHHRWDSSER